jgi:hypothetical protein
VAAPSLDGDDDEDETEEAEFWESDEGEEELEVDEEEFLATRPKPAGFGEGKTYSTDIEEQLLREMGFGGGGARRRGEAAPANRRAGDSSTKVTAAGWPSALLSPTSITLRVASRVTAKLKKNQEEDPSYVISFILETKNVAQRHHAMWRHL